MESKYLIVDKNILPDYFEKVVQARALLEHGDARDVSDAVRKVGISRSTYYKYKDYLIEPNTDMAGRKAILSIMLRNEPGVLSEVLNVVAENGFSIWTINGNPPIGGQAIIILALDISGASISTDTLITEMDAIRGIESVKLVGIE